MRRVLTGCMLLSLATLMSCGAGIDGGKNYGEPVFGSVTEQKPVVATSCGLISGENRDGVAIFRGIPYGGPCDGNNRWKPPTPVTPWEGIRDCTINGPVSMQNSQSISADPTDLGLVFNGGRPELFGCKDEYESENCLVLNVLSPGLDDAARPVVVYIHGGGYATGSGSLVLGADKLAREEDLVIVGVNHRLNIFGYLYLGALAPEFATSGSVGMQDLVQALEWVRDNISRFGGDPDKVTVMGESGGGSKVCNLMGMPSAQGLFCRAIVESGAGSVGSLSPEVAASNTNKLLEKLGLPLEDWRRILEMDAQTLEDAKDGIALSPVADGIIIPFCGKEGDWAPDMSENIPVLVGSSADEMGVFSDIEALASTVTWDNIAEMISRPMDRNLNLSSEKAEDIIRVFKEENYKGDEPWHTYLKITSLGGSLGNGAERLATARSEKDFAPVYQYLVEYDSPSVVSPEYRCAWHTADLPLQFRIVLHEECEQLSRQMAHSWASFIRTGNPSTETLPWPAFDNVSRQVMVFDDVTSVKTDPLARITAVFR